MNQAHPKFGSLKFRPESWDWIGSFIEHRGAVKLRLRTYFPNQVPGLYVTSILPQFVEGIERVVPNLLSYKRTAAAWICSNLKEWFEDESLDTEVVLSRLTVSCIDLSPDGSASIWIEEPQLHESGHDVEVGVDTEGVANYLNLC